MKVFMSVLECVTWVKRRSVEEVNEFKYLGSVMCKPGGTDRETRERQGKVEGC